MGNQVATKIEKSSATLDEKGDEHKPRNSSSQTSLDSGYPSRILSGAISLMQRFPSRLSTRSRDSRGENTSDRRGRRVSAESERSEAAAESIEVFEIKDEDDRKEHRPARSARPCSANTEGSTSSLAVVPPGVPDHE